MRLPFIQVTQESWAKARILAALLGTTRREALGLLCDLWAWALDLGPADEPPTGEVHNARAERILAGALEWTADPITLLAALVDIGVVEPIPTGIRVRGMDRYKRTWEKNKRRKPAPVAPVTGTILPVTGRLPAPQTQTQTQTQTHTEATTPHAREANSPFLAAPRQPEANPPAQSKPLPAETERPSPAPYEPLRHRMEAAWETQHGSPYAWTSNDDLAVRGLMAKSNGDDAVVLGRWCVAMTWQEFPTCSSVVDLDRHWNAYGKPPRQRKATGDPRKSPVRAEDVDRSSFANPGPVKDF